MRFVKWLIPIALAAAALKPAARLSERLRGIRQQLSIPTLVVEPDTFIVGLTAEHPLEGCNVTVVRAQRVSGKLAYICPDGAVVREGDVVAKLDTKDLERRLDDTRLAYSSAQAKVAQDARAGSTDVENARHAVEQGERELEVMLKANATELQGAENDLEQNRLVAERSQLDCERQRRLASPEIGLVSRHDVEQAERALRAATFAVTTAEKALEFMKKRQKADIEQKKEAIANAEYKLKAAEAAIKPAADAARYSIQSTKERLEEAQKDLEMATIRAPAAGTAVIRTSWDWESGGPHPYRVGDQVNEGARLVSISDMSCMQVNLLVDESRISPVRAGQQVLLTFEAAPGKVYRGTVESISPSASSIDSWDEPTLKKGVRYFTVNVALKDHDSRLRPGLKCKAQIVLGRLNGVLAVPVSALVRRGGHDYVYVHHSESFSARQVEIGDRNEEAVVIKKGLKPREVVALRDPTAPAEE